MEGLAFGCKFPQGWVRVPLPEEPFDPSDPTAFLPLLVGMAPYGAVVFTVAARPAYENGTVEDWVEYLAEHNSLRIERLTEARVGPHPALLIDSSQDSDVGRMRVRTLFLEDAGRLYNIGAMAPEAIWPSVGDLLESLLGSFRLVSPGGPGAQLMRQMTSEPSVVVGAVEAIEAEVPTPEPIDIEVDTEDPRSTANAPPPPGRATQPAEVALADDASSLDPENPVNARLRDNGVGLVPRVVMESGSSKFATVGAGAIEALFRVPFGWHVIDDGRRTLVFDGGGRMQINLDLRGAGPDEHTALLDRILGEVSESNPGFEHMRLELDGMPCLALRNLDVDGERLQQAYVVRESNRPDMALVCRVTANDDDMTFAMNTAEVILASIQPAVEEIPDGASAGDPEWWLQALRLEQAGRLQEAEELLEKSIDHIGCYSSIARLYELRQARLASNGDQEGADAAAEKAVHWLTIYASSATSGGEGAALSMERDQRIGAIRGQSRGEGQQGAE
jgi:hypothetical protein